MEQDRIFRVALAFFQQQDLRSMTPEEAMDQFDKIHDAMKKQDAKNRRNQRTSQ